jgi:hypothetical protein
MVRHTRGGDHGERAAAVAGQGREHRCPDTAADGGQIRGLVSDGDALRRACLRIKLGYGAVQAVSHPDGATGVGDTCR